MNRPGRVFDVVSQTDETTMRMEVRDRVNDRLGKLDERAQQRVTFDHSIDQSMHTDGRRSTGERRP